MRLFKKGQGATEYLLMLAAVLVIVAIAVYYVTSTGPSAIITGTARLAGTAGAGVDVYFTPSNTLTPSPIAAIDWTWSVYRGGALQENGTAGIQTLTRGIPVTLDITTAAVQVGDTLKITYKGSTYDVATVQAA
jgi:hypothetical protein